MLLFSSAEFFFSKYTFQKMFQEHYQSVKLFGSKSELTELARKELIYIKDQTAVLMRIDGQTKIIKNSNTLWLYTCKCTWMVPLN